MKGEVEGIDVFTGTIGPDAEARRVAAQERWRAAGLSFWRLVWIVALGILLAQGIAATALWLLRALSA